MKFFAQGNWSRVMLFIWFLIYGILAVTNIKFDGQDKALGFLALITAVTILFGL